MIAHPREVRRPGLERRNGLHPRTAPDIYNCFDCESQRSVHFKQTVYRWPDLWSKKTGLEGMAGGISICIWVLAKKTVVELFART